MKKLICLVIALVCFASLAMAESTPSKTVEDLYKVDVVETENGQTFILDVVLDDEAAKTEAEKLNAAASVESYFGEVKNYAGEVVNMKEYLNAETLNVFEFTDLKAENFSEEMGQVTAVFQFATPYEAGTKVLMLIGEKQDDTVTWTAFDGEVTEEGVKVVLPADVVKNIQDGVRILGNGELTKKLTVVANGFTKSAEEKIAAAGGKVEKLG